MSLKEIKIKVAKKKAARTIPNTKNIVGEFIGKLPRVSGDTKEMEKDVLRELSTDNEGNLEIPSRAVDSKSLSKKKGNEKKIIWEKNEWWEGLKSRLNEEFDATKSDICNFWRYSTEAKYDGLLRDTEKYLEVDLTGVGFLPGKLKKYLDNEMRDELNYRYEFSI